MASNGRPRKYSAAQKAEALRLYPEVGAAEAARRVGGVPAGVVRMWAHRAGLARQRVVQGRTHAEAIRLSWAQRRGELTVELGEVAARLLERVPDAKPLDARNLAIAAAVMIDKAQLIDGGATDRLELQDADARAERVRALRDELAGRRRARGG